MARRGPAILLARHGETEWSLSGQHTGTTDIPLTDNGREAARRLGRRLGGREFALVLTSPLQRARETCQLAGLGERAQIDENLREFDYGEYEGRTTKEIREERPDWDLWRDGNPGGETAGQVGARVDAVILRAREAGGDVALFAHGHVLRVLGARWCGLAPEAGRLLSLGTAALCDLGYEHENSSIWLWNDTSHLHAPG
jgi:probable phosphoglycerate mutase